MYFENITIQKTFFITKLILLIIQFFLKIFKIRIRNVRFEMLYFK